MDLFKNHTFMNNHSKLAHPKFVDALKSHSVLGSTQHLLVSTSSERDLSHSHTTWTRRLRLWQQTSTASPSSAEQFRMPET